MPSLGGAGQGQVDSLTLTTDEVQVFEVFVVGPEGDETARAQLDPSHHSFNLPLLPGHNEYIVEGVGHTGMRQQAALELCEVLPSTATGNNPSQFLIQHDHSLVALLLVHRLVVLFVHLVVPLHRPVHQLVVRVGLRQLLEVVPQEELVLGGPLDGLDDVGLYVEVVGVLQGSVELHHPLPALDAFEDGLSLGVVVAVLPVYDEELVETHDALADHRRQGVPLTYHLLHVGHHLLAEVDHGLEVGEEHLVGLLFLQQPLLLERLLYLVLHYGQVRQVGALGVSPFLQHAQPVLGVAELVLPLAPAPTQLQDEGELVESGLLVGREGGGRLLHYSQVIILSYSSLR